MLRRQMATKKKEMPKDLEKETPAVHPDEALDDDDLEVDLDEDALEDLEVDDPLDVDVVVDDEDEDEAGDAIEILPPPRPRSWRRPARPRTKRKKKSPRTRTSKRASTSS